MTPLEIILHKKNSAATNPLVGGATTPHTAPPQKPPDTFACPACGSPLRWMDGLGRLHCPGPGCDPPKFAGLVRAWLLSVWDAGGWRVEDYQPRFDLTRRRG